MTDPREFLKVLFETFDKSAVQDFRDFLAANPGVTKWQIAADFCLHDKERPNSTYAFSLIPYDAYPATLTEEIRTHIPKDLKKTRDVPSQTIEFLRNQRRFHFAFIFAEEPAIFRNGNVSDNPLVIARQSIDMSLQQLTEHGRSKENLRRLKLLRQESLAKGFNVRLLTDIYVLAYLYCFVSLALARERKMEILGWFSDRDSMNIWCDGVLWDIASESLHGFANFLKIEIPRTSPIVATPTPGASPDKAMWYDEYVRLPDYFAGILAAWNLDANLIPGDKEKYGKLARELIADATNTAIFRVRYQPDVVSVSRCLFNLEQVSGSAATSTEAGAKDATPRGSAD